jgi:Domain of unknown function (DUF3850)
MTPDAQQPQREPIELKCWSVSFQAIKDGSKRFEYRKDDRPYEVGRTLWQREWNPDTLYSGDELYHDITFIIRGGVFGIPEGYCIVSTSEPRSTRARPHTPAPCTEQIRTATLAETERLMVMFQDILVHGDGIYASSAAVRDAMQLLRQAGE